MVNEIALEEQTLPPGSNCAVERTPNFTQAFGQVTIGGNAATVGTVIRALNIRGDTVGCYTVGTSGGYGFLRLYGEDTSVNPPIPGVRDGEMVIFQVNGATAVSTPLLIWHNDRLPHQIDLSAGNVVNQSILQDRGWNLVSFRVEPPYPLIPIVLQSIDNRYDRVLGEDGGLISTRFTTL